MKKILLTLCLCAFAVNVFGQLTNGVKVSGLTSATTPLAGTELVPLVQSGTTKSATVAQIVNAPAVSIVTASNWLSLNLASNAASIITASNYFQLRANTNATANITTSNYFSAVNLTNAAALLTTSNGLAARLGSSNWLTSYDVASSNFQSAAQVTAAAQAAVSAFAATGVATNAGNANLRNLTFAALPSANSFTVLTNATNTIDLAAASLQQFSFSTPIAIDLANIGSGQNVSAIFFNFNANTRAITFPAGVRRLTSGSSVNVASGKYCIFNFTSFGSGGSPSSVLFSASVEQ